MTNVMECFNVSCYHANMDKKNLVHKKEITQQ